MKKTIQLSSLMLLISSGVFAQANSSYWLNANPINGTYNTAFGTFALLDNTTGFANAANGYEALTSNTTGIYNQASGYQSLYENTTGNYNTANGYLSLTFNTTGSSNSAIGYGALKNNLTGYANSGLGTLANVSTGGLFASTAIGSFAITNANYKVRIGANTVTVIEGQVPYSYPSDGRFKNNISETDVKGLDFIKKLRPVVYNFDTKKFQEFLTKNMPDSVRQEYLKADFTASTAIRQSGFIAQEVEVAAQQCGYNFNGVHKPNDDNDNYSIAYSQFVVPLVKGMQEQQKMIEAQQQEIDELKKILKDLAAQTTGISATTMLNEVSVYPNPNKGVFAINTNNIEAGKIQVLNPKGAQIQEITIQNGQSNYQIDLTAYPKGIYLINILSDKGSSSKKIIVE